MRANKKVSKDQILLATRNYVNRYRNRNYAFMRTASNFIYKNSVELSDLMAEIENLNSTNQVIIGGELI